MISNPKAELWQAGLGLGPHPSGLCRAQLVTGGCVTPCWLRSHQEPNSNTSLVEQETLQGERGKEKEE